ncbi:MAG: helix-turn-helix domain-containing protein [bacterium]|nr:helix-turn-helix domain-containing protein [bacterium]MDY4100840.1 helix-turn-helix domain-containing protein [Lachnospiraceae bacterium]
MAQTYEISRFESNMPIRCYVHHIGHIAMHAHEFFEIIFILSGECSLIMDDHFYQLREDDMIIVEHHIPHELRSGECVYASVQLDQISLEKHFPVPVHPTFECNSQVPGKEKAYDQLRTKIAQIIKTNADKALGYELRNWIYVWELMEILYLNFRVDRSEAAEKRNYRYESRVYEISRIIKEHYTEDLTLSSLADMLHLSVPYLSKFFLEHFGVNFSTYLTQLRIKKAVFDLTNTEKNIEMIAVDAGFPNSNAFTTAFKKEYGILPSAYRRQLKNAEPLSPASPITHSNYMSSLRKYLHHTNETVPSTVPLSFSAADFSIQKETKKLTHTWKRILSVGQASDILLADIQKMLIRMQTEIGFEYLFFNGIFSDGLFVFKMGAKHTPTYNFAYIDRIFDFLLSIHLKPMMQLSYMPKDLAKTPDRYMLNHLLSEPKDLTIWCDLVQHFMEHIMNRYGIHEILTWKFSVWHQPNTPYRLFGFEAFSDFKTFYKKTYDVVKAFDPRICFGLPCMYYLQKDVDNHLVDELISYCKENNCIPDYLNFTFYDTILGYNRNHTKDSFGFIDSMTLNTKPEGLKLAISDIKNKQHAFRLDKLPLYISEWNNTPSQQDYLNDTCFKSCYIVKNILENYDRLDGLGYWALSDLMAEQALPDSLFFGGLGLFTVNALPKAGFYAMTFLNYLGDTLIDKGEGWFATKTDHDIRILAYHYHHFSDLYATGELFDMTETERYTMFESVPSLSLKIQIDDLEDQTYSISERILNREYGSLFDIWATAGDINLHSTEECQYLERRCLPGLHKFKAAADNHSLTLQFTLEPLEVRLITIK